MIAGIEEYVGARLQLGENPVLCVEQWDPVPLPVMMAGVSEA